MARQGPSHTKEGGTHLHHHVLGRDAVEGHALGTCHQDAKGHEAPEKRTA